MIIRGHTPSETYALVPRPALEDGALSFKARGLYACIVAMHDGQSTSAERLAKSGTDGERAVKSGLRELEDAGYLTRTADGDLTLADGQQVGTPTPQPVLPNPLLPDPLVRPADAPAGWRPSEQAIKTAKKSIELMDIELFIIHYTVRMKQLNREPSSGEWLTWLIREEEKLRVEEKRQARENGKQRPWYAVAGD